MVDPALRFLPASSNARVRSSTFALIAIALGGQAMAVGQASPPAGASQHAATAESTLLALHSLATQGVFALQPLQGGGGPPGERGEPKDRGRSQEGSSATRRFATIRDARFDAGGQLLCLLVVSGSTGDAGGVDVVRELPAADVRWDEGRRQWLLVDPNLRFAGLLASGSAPVGEPPAKAPPATALLASQILQATCDPQTTVAAPKSSAPPPEAPAPKAAGRSVDPAPSPPAVAVVWMAGVAKRLVVVQLPYPDPQPGGEPTGTHVVVPWSLVHVAITGNTARLRVTAATATMRGAPRGSPTEAPTRALRDRCYLHYGMTPPEWEGASAAPGGAGRQPLRELDR